MTRRVVFFGTPDYVIPALEALYSLKRVELAAVVTAPDARKGRGKKLTPPPVKTWAIDHNIPVLQPEKLIAEQFLSALQSLEPTVGVVASYGKIIPQAVMGLFPRGILNIHPSLLPKFRGATPVASAVLEGEEKTGVTIIAIDEKMDHGPIVVQEAYPLSGDETTEKLRNALFQKGAEMLKDILVPWVEEKIEPRPQNHDQATYTKTFTREDGRIDWSMPAEVIERMVRAYTPWPGTFIEFPDGMRLKILNASPIEIPAGLPSDLPPGMFIKHPDGLFVISAANHTALVLHTVQPAGKKPMSGADFMHGYFAGQNTPIKDLFNA